MMERSGLLLSHPGSVCPVDLLNDGEKWTISHPGSILQIYPEPNMPGGPELLCVGNRVFFDLNAVSL